MPRPENHDGWVDVAQVKGAMLNNISLFHSEVKFMGPMLMFRNVGRGKFAKVSELLGPVFLKPNVGRGLAVADFDNDGDQDLAISVSGTYPELVRNDGGDAENWLEIMLVGKRSNRDGVGTALKLVSEGYMQCGHRKGGMSCMSAHDRRVHFGLGQRKSIDLLEITWPSGTVDKLTRVPINQIITLKEGAGFIPRSFPLVPSI